ncbi:hypothetical protein K1719_043745 [Acacia pycnantha]|nr:hypothetical protein K1719_043745 [Acacia pycnantha]
MEEPTISDRLIWKEDKTEKVLIGKVLSARTFSRVAIERILQKAWNLQSGFDVIKVTGNAFMFKFLEEEEYNRILCGRPWSINGFLLDLMERAKYKSCEDFDFSHCLIWIQIHNVLMEAMHLENSIRIGGYAGEVLLAEDPHYKGRFIRNFMRVRVLLDFRKSLASGFWMNKPNDVRIWITIRYEKLQDFCYSCGRIDHDYHSCRSERLMSVVNSNEPRFGSCIATSQCRNMEDLIVAVRDDWSEASYFKKKKEEATIRRENDLELRMAQEAEHDAPSMAGVATVSPILGKDTCWVAKAKPQVVSPASMVEKGNTRSMRDECSVEDPGNPLAIIPYCESSLREVINGIGGLGLKCSAEADLEVPSTKRRRLIAGDPEGLGNAISTYAGNLSKVKSRLKRQGKRKGRSAKENIPMEILEWKEEMEASDPPSTDGQGFVFKAKGGRWKKMEAVAPRTFKFEANWVKHVDFLKVVSNSWKEATDSKSLINYEESLAAVIWLGRLKRLGTKKRPIGGKGLESPGCVVGTEIRPSFTVV